MTRREGYKSEGTIAIAHTNSKEHNGDEKKLYTAKLVKRVSRTHSTSGARRCIDKVAICQTYTFVEVGAVFECVLVLLHGSLEVCFFLL